MENIYTNVRVVDVDVDVGVRDFAGRDGVDSCCWENLGKVEPRFYSLDAPSSSAQTGAAII